MVILEMNTHNITGIGTVGELRDHNNKVMACTVEKEWKNNAPSISCVPAGLYELKQMDSPKYGPGMWHLHNPDLGVYAEWNKRAVRTDCLFRVANFPKNVKGCVGLGTEYHPSTWGVANSRIAVSEFNRYMNDLVGLPNADIQMFLRIKRY